jgi:hypothetical protein
MSEFAELVRELRALPTEAPERVRERVRALGEPAPRRTPPHVPWRQSLLVLAPSCALLLVIAAVFYGVLDSGGPGNQQALTYPRVTAGEAGPIGATPPLLASPDVRGTALVPPDTTRHQDYEASMTLRVSDLDVLTDRTNDAMQVVRSFGGYVASVHQSTQAGHPGEADLMLRIPVGHVEAAMVRLSELGTVLARQVSVVDLEQTLRQQRGRILRLKLFIARATEQLKSSLPADVRLRLQLQLQQARDELARVSRANGATLNEAALSHVALTLTTQRAVVPVPKSGTGRFGRAASDAGSFLAGAGAVVLFLLIVVSPLIVVALVAALGLRAYRRREERRLLAT